jgi:hypothetical protein
MDTSNRKLHFRNISKKNSFCPITYGDHDLPLQFWNSLRRLDRSYEPRKIVYLPVGGSVLTNRVIKSMGLAVIGYRHHENSYTLPLEYVDDQHRISEYQSIKDNQELSKRGVKVAMTDLDHICEYFIWWPDKDKDPNKQVCPNWAPSGRFMFDDGDDEHNKIFIRLCSDHLAEISERSKNKPRPKSDKLKYYRIRKYTIDQDIDGTGGEIVKEGYDYRGDGYMNEVLSVDSNEKEKYKYRYLLVEVSDSDDKALDLT